MIQRGEKENDKSFACTKSQSLKYSLHSDDFCQSYCGCMTEIISTKTKTKQKTKQNTNTKKTQKNKKNKKQKNTKEQKRTKNKKKKYTYFAFLF